MSISPIAIFVKQALVPALCGLAACAEVQDEERPLTLIVHSETTFQSHWKEQERKWWGGTAEIDRADVYHYRARGSGFRVTDPTGRAVVVTARHVVLPSVTNVEVQGITRLLSRPIGIRVRIDGASIQPERIVMDGESDLALLWISRSEAAMLSARPVDLSKSVKPRLDQGVFVWGFPGTPNQYKGAPGSVTEIRDLFGVINQHYAFGMSGGLVVAVDEAQPRSLGLPVGILVRSEAGAAPLSRFILMRHLETLLSRSATTAIRYRDNMTLDELTRPSTAAMAR